MTNPHTWAPTLHETHIARRVLLLDAVVGIVSLPVVACIAGLGAGLAVFATHCAIAFIAWCFSLPERTDR